ncbi:MAG TPA: FAD-dependent oxidoreductase [Meiothermus sp.]|nr:FAD-dependent oxidoreductase [Meiothermus sp.]
MDAAATYIADVLVVGAGIVGVSCAYRLAERGLKVRVLEAAAAPAMGSTGKSAAGVRVQFSEPTNILLSWRSIQEYRQMPEAAYRPVGYLFLVPESEWPEHRKAVELQRSLEVPVEELGLEDAQHIVEFDPEGLAGATLGPADGVVDPHGITMEYLRRARALGGALHPPAVAAQLHLETELLRATRRGQVWNVETSRGTFEAPFILNAAGAWAGEVGKRAGLEIPVQPARRLVFATAPTAWKHSYPLTIDLSSGFWFRSEGERIIFGKSNLAEVGFSEGMDWAWLEPTLEAGLARFPWLAKTALDRKASWWGYYEVTPDHNPILGRMPGVEGWVNACGFSGHGVQQAATVGRLMAEEITEGRASTLNIDSLRYERFSSRARVAERNIV